MLGVSMRASADALDDSLLCVMSEADVERLVLTKPRVPRQAAHLQSEHDADLGHADQQAAEPLVAKDRAGV